MEVPDASTNPYVLRSVVAPLVATGASHEQTSALWASAGEASHADGLAAAPGADLVVLSGDAEEAPTVEAGRNWWRDRVD